MAISNAQEDLLFDDLCYTIHETRSIVHQYLQLERYFLANWSLCSPQTLVSCFNWLSFLVWNVLRAFVSLGCRRISTSGPWRRQQIYGKKTRPNGEGVRETWIIRIFLVWSAQGFNRSRLWWTDSISKSTFSVPWKSVSDYCLFNMNSSSHIFLSLNIHWSKLGYLELTIAQQVIYKFIELFVSGNLDRVSQVSVVGTLLNQGLELEALT